MVLYFCFQTSVLVGICMVENFLNKLIYIVFQQTYTASQHTVYETKFTIHTERRKNNKQ